MERMLFKKKIISTLKTRKLRLREERHHAFSYISQETTEQGFQLRPSDPSYLCCQAFVRLSMLLRTCEPPGAWATV